MTQTWGSSLADDGVGPTWEVGPTEDVVQALMETLVDPLLPLSVSDVPPQEDDQKSVAKQMHAVVLLYNYHHRRQKPELKFLDFPSFCKLSVVVKPPLVSFMKLTKETGSTKSNAAENQLSITEKAIKDACDIALALGAKSESPNIEGWPISKVAILLIDSKKENCMLRFGDVTKGVWSLIEKELDASNINQDMLSDEKISDKKKLNSLPTYDDDEFLQLGYDAMNHITGTGIGSRNPQVLSTHTTYSLSKEKSAVRFYMVQCSGSFDVKEEVSLKFLVDRSLQGPLAEKLNYGFWKTTTVVEFYHMLPYVDFISCWLSGISGAEVNSSDKIPTENCDRNPPEHLSHGNVKSPVRISQSTSKDGINCTANLDEKCDDLYSAGNKKSRIGLEVSDTDNVVEKKFKKKHDGAHLDQQSDDRRDKDLLSGPLSGLKEMNTNEMTKTCTESEDASQKVISKLRVYHHRKKNNSSTQNNASVREDGGHLKVHTASSLNLHHPECRDEKVVNEDKGDVTISNDQRAIEAKSNCSVQVQNISASEELQNALSLLYRKRQELYSQVCNMEDILAFCDHDIIRIRDGGDVGVARECIKVLLSGSYHSMLEHGTQNQDNSESHREKKTRLSEIYLPGKSSRQDLEYICLTNNWRLPRYLIELSDGSTSCKFVSNVFVQGKDNIELHSKGDVEYNPCEARESAAAQMIAKLRNL
ncbi:hypothetical protein OROGR_021118 [Orobanche gracilis]